MKKLYVETFYQQNNILSTQVTLPGTSLNANWQTLIKQSTSKCLHQTAAHRKIPNSVFETNAQAFKPKYQQYRLTMSYTQYPESSVANLTAQTFPKANTTLELSGPMTKHASKVFYG